MTKKNEFELTVGELVVKRALEYAEKNLKEIDVFPGNFMGNNKCYQNARQVLEADVNGRAVAVLAFKPDGKWVILHFVNKTRVVDDFVTSERYVDNTLGYQANFYRYFYLKEYTKQELDDYSENKVYPQIIDDLQDMYLNMWFTPVERKTFGIGREHF